MGVWVWKYSLKENKYVISADVSRGDAADYSTFQVLDITNSEQVAEYRGKLPPDQFAVLLAEAGSRYGDALICPENNTYGFAVVMKLVELGYKNLYFKNEKDKFASMYSGETNLSKIGFTTSAISRGQILTKFEQVLRNNTVSFYSSRLLEELKTFVWKGTKAQAQKGKNDDLVIAAAIGTWLFDSDPKVSKQSTDLNKAMLEGFAVNSRQFEKTQSPWEKTGWDPTKPYGWDSMPMSGSSNGLDMSWLL
jgi:hypothetical protein